jgi:OmpA family
MTAMSRKTPPVASQVVKPRLLSNAFLKGRLIDFDTGGSQLEGQHRAWLREKMSYARLNSMYRIRLVGYASKLGDPKMNLNLSYARTDAVLKFLQSVDNNAMDRVETFRAVGEAAYQAAESDDSADWRAVEVHIFIGDIPPTPPPPNLNPVPHNVEPLPGGERFTKWEVASPGGAFVAEGPGFGFNIFFIKNSKLTTQRGYIQPAVGVGASLGLSGLNMFWKIIQQIITGAQSSDPDFTNVTSKVPVTWEDMEDCLVRVSSAGAGLVKGASIAVITFTAAGVWQRDPSGFPLRKVVPGGDLFQFPAAGENWQIGAGASTALGPIVRVPG